MLQSRTESARRATEALDRQERKYLPMLRSLSLLELELESDIKDSYYSEADDSRPEQYLYNAGTELRRGRVLLCTGW
jgi:hypothetical protein